MSVIAVAWRRDHGSMAVIPEHFDLSLFFVDFDVTKRRKGTQQNDCSDKMNRHQAFDSQKMSAFVFHRRKDSDPSNGRERRVEKVINRVLVTDLALLCFFSLGDST